MLRSSIVTSPDHQLPFASAGAGTRRVPVVVLRHPREYLPKCTLTPLHGRPEFTFLTATANFRLEAVGLTLLTPEAPALTAADRGRPLLVLDSTWRLLPRLLKCLRGAPVPRAIPPGIVTAYPRRSKNFADPDAGLASIEAIYVARRILGDDDPTLLSGYRWTAQFLAQFSVPALTPPAPEPRG